MNPLAWLNQTLFALLPLVGASVRLLEALAVGFCTATLVFVALCAASDAVRWCRARYVEHCRRVVMRADLTAALPDLEREGNALLWEDKADHRLPKERRRA